MRPDPNARVSTRSGELPWWGDGWHEYSNQVRVQQLSRSLFGSQSFFEPDATLQIHRPWERLTVTDS